MRWKRSTTFACFLCMMISLWTQVACSTFPKADRTPATGGGPVYQILSLNPDGKYLSISAGRLNVRSVSRSEPGNFPANFMSGDSKYVVFDGKIQLPHEKLSPLYFRVFRKNLKTDRLELVSPRVISSTAAIKRNYRAVGINKKGNRVFFYLAKNAHDKDGDLYYKDFNKREKFTNLSEKINRRDSFRYLASHLHLSPDGETVFYLETKSSPLYPESPDPSIFELTFNYHAYNIKKDEDVVFLSKDYHYFYNPNENPPLDLPKSVIQKALEEKDPFTSLAYFQSSYDGKRLIFYHFAESYKHDKERGTLLRRELTYVDLNKKDTLKELTYQTVKQANISNNGQYVVYFVKRDPKHQRDFIVIRNIETDKRVEIYDPHNIDKKNFIISNDGEHFLFGIGIVHKGPAQLYLYNVSTLLTYIVSNNPVLKPANMKIETPFLTPDEKRLSFVSEATNLLPGRYEERFPDPSRKLQANIFMLYFEDLVDLENDDYEIDLDNLPYDE